MDQANFFASEAVKYDRLGQTDAALHFYTQASNLIEQLVSEGKLTADCRNVADRYKNRIRELHAQNEKRERANAAQRANSLLNEAINKEEKGELTEALNLYASAAEICIQISKTLSINEEEEVNKFKSLALMALERAESIKSKTKKDTSGTTNTNPLSSSKEPDVDFFELPTVPIDELNNLYLSPGSSSASPNVNAIRKILPVDQPKSTLFTSPASGQLTEKEIAVLATTSKINLNTYLPFMPEEEKRERFHFPLPFCDREGLPVLAEKQKKHFVQWLRPEEFVRGGDEPKVIELIDSGTIKQTLISDCSFVASLAIAARYERRFGKKLVTKIIYPQNSRGEPVYNPSGKYMIRLHLNGIWRKVIVDDRFPIGREGQLLCSYSQNRSEIWVSLLEKAYMKVMGGYDFPGSNSNIDLNALTGWIPERIAIRENGSQFDSEKVFERLFSRFHQGHCLITLATAPMDQTEQDRTGLVETHAYAVLDLRKFEDKRLLLLKNPWTHMRWKGRYSENDLEHWTPELCKALDYNPRDAKQFDDGVFWIDYPSVLHFFDVFYVNWDPAVFPFSYALHASWTAGQGPVRDLYTVGDNPQYALEVNNRHGTASVWILLSRHITEKEDFARNREYITVMVYRTNGNRIFLPYEPKPLVDAARINSPHFLCQLPITEPGVSRYTLVIAQYEKMKTIYYTLRVYSSAEFRCGPIRNPYRCLRKETGEWRGKTAGGCGNSSSRDTFQNNPIFHVSLADGSDTNSVLVQLKAPKEYNVGFEFFQVSSFRNKPFESQISGPFRSGYTVLEVENVPGGVYAIRPMTFLAGQEGPFILQVDASCDFVIRRVQ